MTALSLQTVFCFFLAFWPCPVIVEIQHDVLNSRNRGKQAFTVRMYVKLAKYWDIQNVCCSCRSQRLQIPLASLFLLPLLILGFPRYSSSESVPCNSFNYSSLLLYQSPVSVTRMWGRQECSIIL